MKSIHENIKVEEINLKLESKTKSSLLKDMFKLIENNKNILDKEKAFQDLIAYNTKLSYSNMETTLMLLMLYEASSL